MGDPKKKRRKYSTPKHPWQSERLEKEKELLGNYSFKNKKEIWKMEAILKKYTDQAKKLANLKTEQAKKEKEQMINKLFKMGVVKKNSDIDDVLGLKIINILDRRLQTMVYKKGMANTSRQARQFIVHGHIFVGDGKISVPSYLVNLDEENSIHFKDNSGLIGRFGKSEEEGINKDKKIKDVKKDNKKENFKKASEGKRVKK